MTIIRVTPTIGLPIQTKGTPLWGTNLNSGLDTIDAAFLADRNRLTALETTNAILPVAIVSKVGHNILRNNSFERGVQSNPAQAVGWNTQHLNGASGYSQRDNVTSISGTWSNRITITSTNTSPLVQIHPYPGLNVLDPVDDQPLANTDQRQLLNGFGYCFQTVNLLPKTTYTVSSYGKAELLNFSLNINVKWKIGIVFKDTMNAITHSYFSNPLAAEYSSNSIYSDSFTRVELTFTTPTLPVVTAEVWLVAESVTPSSIGSVWFDGAQLEQATKATALDSFSMQGSNMFVDGDLTVGGKLSLQQEDLVFDSNKVTFLGSVQIGDDITVDTLEVFTKSAVFHGPLSVSGNVTLGDDPLVDKVDVLATKTTFFNNQDTLVPNGGDVEIQGDLEVKGNTILGSDAATDTLTINALTTFADTSFDITGDVSVDGGLKVKRAVELGTNSLSDTLVVKMSAGGSFFEGDVRLKNNLIVDGYTILGDNLSDTVTIKAGNTSLAGSLEIDNALLVHGPVTLDIGNGVSDNFYVNSSRTDIVASLGSSLNTPIFDVSGKLTAGNGSYASFDQIASSVGALTNILSTFSVYANTSSFSKDVLVGEDLQVVGNINSSGSTFVLGNAFQASSGTLAIGNPSNINIPSNTYSDTLHVYAGTTYFGDFATQKKGHVNVGGNLSVAGDVTLGSSIAEDLITIAGSQVNMNVGSYFKVGGGFQNNTYDAFTTDHGGVDIDNKGNIRMDGKLTVKGPFDPVSILISPLLSDGSNAVDVLTVYSPTLSPNTTFNLTSSGDMKVASSILVSDGYVASIDQSTSFGTPLQPLTSFNVYSSSPSYLGNIDVLSISSSDLATGDITAANIFATGSLDLQGNLYVNGTQLSFGSAPALITTVDIRAHTITLGVDGQNIGDVTIGSDLVVRNNLAVGSIGQYSNNTTIANHTSLFDVASYRPSGRELAGLRVGGMLQGGGFQDNIYNSLDLYHGGVTIDAYGNIFADGNIIAKGSVGFDSITLTTPINGDPNSNLLTVVNNSTGDGYVTLTIDGYGNIESSACITAEDCIISKDYGQIDGYLVLSNMNKDSAPLSNGLGLSIGTSNMVFNVRRYDPNPQYGEYTYGSPSYATTDSSTLEIDDIGNLWSNGHIYTQQPGESNLATYSITVGDGYYGFGDRNANGIWRVTANPIADAISDLVTRGVGGTVFVKAGTFTLNATLSVPSNVSIRGEYGTVIDGAGLYGIQLASNSGLTNISLQNCSTAISLPIATSNATVNEVSISSSTTAISIAGSKNYISGVVITSGTNGFNLTGSNNSISSCEVTVSGTQVANSGLSNYVQINNKMYTDALTVYAKALELSTAENANVDSQLVRTVNTPSSWKTYLPSGSTNYRVRNVADGYDVSTVTRLGAHTWGVAGNSNMHKMVGYGKIESPTQTVRAAGSETLDCDTQHIFYKTGGTATITLSNLSEGQTVTLVMVSTGSVYSLSWAPSIKWPAAAVPSPTSVAGRYDVYNFIKIGNNIFGTVGLNFG